MPRPDSLVPAHAMAPLGSAPPARQLTLLDLLDRILDKGIVINGDITLSFASVDLLSLKVNLVIASLETAKRYGIELPWEKWERQKKELKQIVETSSNEKPIESKSSDPDQRKSISYHEGNADEK